MGESRDKQSVLSIIPKKVLLNLNIEFLEEAYD